MIFNKGLFGLCALVCAASAFAITPAEYKVAKEKVSADYKAAKAQCNTLMGNAKDVCKKEAKAREEVAEAELLYQADASEQHRHKLAKVKADMSYDVAREKCDDFKGNAKDICVKDAKAAHVKALEAARVEDARVEKNVTMEKKAADISAAKKEASQNVREAEYKAAHERCDSLTGDAKDKCVVDAKRLYGQ